MTGMGVLKDKQDWDVFLECASCFLIWSLENSSHCCCPCLSRILTNCRMCWTEVKECGYYISVFH